MDEDEVFNRPAASPYREKREQRVDKFRNDPAMNDAFESAKRSVLEGSPEPVPQPQPTPQPSQPARPAFRGGGGGSGFKQNTGRKGGLPQPDADFKIFNYGQGGKVIKSESY